MKIICLILVLFVMGCGKNPRTSDRVSPDKKSPPIVGEKFIAIQKKEKIQLRQLDRDMEILKKRNPFNPRHETTKLYHLTGIIWSKGKPAAIINDTVVREGDMIEGKRVEKITEDKVVLIKNDKRQVLSLRF